MVTKRPRGRSDTIKKSVNAAVVSLLKKKGVEFTHHDVARSARVHHTTIYRRWPTKVDLFRGVLEEQSQDLQIMKTGNFQRDLERFCQLLAVYLAAPVQRTILGYAVSSEGGEIIELLKAHWFPIRDSVEEFVSEAVHDGLLRSDTNPHLFVQLLIGPLIITPLFARRKLYRRETRAIVSRVVRAHVVS